LEERNRKTEADQVVVYPVVVRRKREPAVVAGSCGNGSSNNPFVNPFIYGLESNQVESLSYFNPPAIGYCGVRNEHVELPAAVGFAEGNISHIERNSQQILCPGEMPSVAESLEESIPYVERNPEQILSPGYVGGNIEPVEPRQNLSSLNISSNPFLRGPMDFNFCGSTPAIPENPEPMANESIQETESTVIDRSNEFIHVDTPRRFLQGRTLYRTPPRRHPLRDKREPDRLSYKGGINAIIKANTFFCLCLMNDGWNEWLIFNGFEWMYIIMIEWIWVTLNYIRYKLTRRLFFEVMNNTTYVIGHIFYLFFLKGQYLLILFFRRIN